MPTLILMRHAKAVRENEAASDRARGLTPRGRREAAAAAAALAAQDLAPRIILASSAVRTVETATIVAGVMPPQQGPRFLEQFYLAEPENIWTDAIAAGDESATVLVVGHNPGLHELVARLIGRSGDRSALARGFLSDMPTSAWAAFDVAVEDLAATPARFVAGWTPPRD
jgi:phosphohistidine phosphatase